VAPPAPEETVAEAAESSAAWRTALARLEGWLDALDANNDQAPPHVVEAVRADYRSRLRDLRDAADRRHAELERVRDDAAEAASAAADRRLELRLRYLVGEIDARGLDAGLDEQEEIIARAAREKHALAAELAEVKAFIDHLRQRFPETRERVDPVPSDPFGGDDDLGFLDVLPASTVRSPEPPRPDPRPPAASSGHSLAADSYLGSTLAREHFICRHCGTANEASHWYCDGCGAELG